LNNRVQTRGAILSDSLDVIARFARPRSRRAAVEYNTNSDLACEECSSLCALLSDIDECVESINPCFDPDTICVNTLGAYECRRTSANLQPIRTEYDREENRRFSSLACAAGYKLSNSSRVMACIDIDECNEQLNSCEPGERCVNEIGSYR
jgi:hypothetical protein